MAYQIRYGFDKMRHKEFRDQIRFQFLTASGLLLLTVLAQLWDGGETLTQRLFSPSPESLGERAVSAFAGALARGEGWYQGLAVWCRTILDGASG